MLKIPSNVTGSLREWAGGRREAIRKVSIKTSTVFRNFDSPLWESPCVTGGLRRGEREHNACR